MVDKLWAPWRFQYVKSYQKTTKQCFICAAGRARNPIKHLVVDSDPFTVTMLNKFPYNTGHLMVSPRTHKATIHELDHDELFHLFDKVRDITSLLKQAYNPQGFNIGINMGDVAGTSLPTHLHVHIVPRWNGDTNYMPVIAETKVIPKALDATVRHLRSFLPSSKEPTS